MATVDDKKIIFSMVGLNKTIQQNNKQVLKNIYLSFFYGAKNRYHRFETVRVKSTLLKIIAGLDKILSGRSGVLARIFGRIFGSGALPRSREDSERSGDGRRTGPL